MAFTKTPTGDTYQTKPVPFKETWETRDRTNSKDTFTQNLVWEEVKTADGDSYYEVMKRDGTVLFSQLDLALPNVVVKAMYYWDYINAVVIVTDTQGVWRIGVDGIVHGQLPTIGIPFISSAGFTEFLYDNGDVNLVIGTTAGWWIYDGLVVTQITDVDFPNPTLLNATPVFLDGYLFAADDTNIYNSNLNDPLNWSASDFIAAESYPDIITAIARNGQYIVCFGEFSIQYFYDAANPTGSPLAAQTTVHKIGFLGGLVEYGAEIYFMGEVVGGLPGLFKLSGLEVSPIVSFPFTREVNDMVGLAGGLYHWNGHAHYNIVYFDQSDVSIYKTIAYDLTTQQWVRMVFKDALWDANTLKMGLSATLKFINLGDFFTVFALTPDGDSNTLRFYRVSPTAYQDDGVNYTVKFRTRNLDFGTRRNKFGSRVLFNCDQTPAPSNMQVSWSVDDYQTYVASRDIDLSTVYPNVPAIGLFRKIGFQFEYADNFPMRWGQSEIDYNLGSS